MRLLFLAAAVAALANTGAAAAPSLAADFGTSGVGAQAGFPINDHVAVRGSYGAGTYSYTYTESDIRYDAKAKPNVGMLMLDLHPFRGVFRVSGGLAYNNTRIEGTANTINGTIVINGQTYTTSEVGSVRGEIRFRKSVPYLGLGWGYTGRGSAGWTFTSDFGVLFSKATGSVTGTCAASLPQPVCAQLQSDLAAESREFLTEVEKVRYYPIARIGIGYRF
jgi:hypothetical protein